MNEETKPNPITLVDLIDKLVLPSEPAPISMMPQTGGWIALGVVLIAAVCAGLLFWLRKRGENAYRRAALRALQSVDNDPAAVAAILRRTALEAFPRSEVAGLSGSAWLTFLDETSGGSSFRQGAGQILALAPYQRSQYDTSDLRGIAEKWIRHHNKRVHR